MITSYSNINIEWIFEIPDLYGLVTWWPYPAWTQLAHWVKEKKSLFYEYINSKKRVKESLHPLPDATGNVSTENKEKAEILNAFFTSIFNSQTSYPQSILLPNLKVLDRSSITPS